MAEVPVFHASVQIGDGAKLLASASFRVSTAKAQAYIAAANAAGRLLTDVGILLDAALDMTESTADNFWRKFSIQADYLNDAFVFPAVSTAIYNSNKWKVTFKTTNAGVPAVDTIYIPQYLVAGVVMESDGISADLTDDPAAAFVTALVAHGLSKYGTAITQVLSIQRNDS